MALSPRLVAIQGIGFTAIALAVQGLLEVLAKNSAYQDMLDAGRSKNAPAPRDFASENLRRMYEARAKDRLSETPAEDYNLTRLHADDMLAFEFIAAVLQMELLDG